MERPCATKWFRLRVACAIGVLAGLAFELSGQRSWPVILLQAVLIVGIIVTSALDLRDMRSRQKATPGAALWVTPNGWATHCSTSGALLVPPAIDHPAWSPGVCRALTRTVLKLRIESADIKREPLVKGRFDHELEQAGSA